MVNDQERQAYWLEMWHLQNVLKSLDSKEEKS